MAVFQNYDPKKAGGVNANAFPNVHVYPWIPTQNNVRSNPNIPGQPQRVSPTERGATFPTSASGGGSLAPSNLVLPPTMAPNSGSGVSCGCGGGCGGSIGRGANPRNRPTASQLATGHTFPGAAGKQAGMGITPRMGVGSIRGTAQRPVALGRLAGRTNPTPHGAMFGQRRLR